MKTPNQVSPKRIRISMSLPLAMSIVVPIAAHAEGVGSHGGSAVTCFKTQSIADRVRTQLQANSQAEYPVDPFTSAVLSDIQSIEVLDLYNEKKYVGPVVSDGRMTEDAMNEIIADRMEALRTTHYALYETMKREAGALPFEPGVWRESTTGVVALFDSKMPTILDRNCLPIQVAHQVNMNKKLTYVYYDSRLFSMLDAANRAALVFHERVYRHYVTEEQATDSMKTQAIVGITFSKGLARSEVAKYFDRFSENGASDSVFTAIVPLSADGKDYLSCTGGLTAKSDGRIDCMSGLLSLGSKIYAEANQISVDPTVDLATNPESLSVGKIGGGTPDSPRIDQAAFAVATDSETGNRRVYLARAAGKYTGFWYHSKDPIFTFTSGINGYGSSDVVYYPNGIVAAETITYISSDRRKVNVDGGANVKLGSRVERDETGKITRVN